MTTATMEPALIMSELVNPVINITHSYQTYVGLYCDNIAIN